MEEIKNAVQSILPNLLPQVLKEACEHLIGLGVETEDDLKYVKSSDLPMLKDIQVRKLISNWKQGSTPSQTSQETTLSDTAIISESVSSSTSEQDREIAKLHPGVNPVWADEFEIPVSKFSQKNLITCLQKGLRPNPSARREMVRILVDEISKISQRPGKRSLATIAQKIVKTYPKSFLDEIEGTRVGTGYDSLLRQLQSRFENINRKSDSNSFKRKSKNSLVAEVEDIVEAGSAPKIYLHDKYGCINYMPSDYPDGESETTQEEKQGLLKQKYREKNHGHMEDLMKDTYFSQRKDIVQRKMDILSLKKEWPYLFEAAGMFVHFMELTGININEKVESAIASKGARILKWIEEEPNMNIRRIQHELVEAKCSVDNGNSEVAAMICAVMSYLHEKQNLLYVCVKPTALRPEFEKDLPQTPCLIGFGESRLTTTRYMLSVDGVVVTDHITTFTTGLAMLLASYYNFNIMYPVDSASTLEFIQRCFVGINPERGSKIEVKKHSKRRTDVHPKVLSLINAIADVEWRS